MTLGNYSHSCALVSLWVRWKCLMRCERYGICATNPMPSAQCTNLLRSLQGSSETSLWSTGSMYLPFVNYRDTGCHWALRYLHANPHAHPCKTRGIPWHGCILQFSFSSPPSLFSDHEHFLFLNKIKFFIVERITPSSFGWALVELPGFDGHTQCRRDWLVYISLGTCVVISLGWILALELLGRRLCTF